jgi:protein-L-isoaspartate(D-aspartate) O-methyltransferase
MVDEQIARRGVKDPDVLDAMRSVPRHLFVPEKYRSDAYRDGPVPIGAGQTISQPYIVASMTEQLELDHTRRVLEIGTGCGYQSAVLAEVAGEVFSIEVVPELYETAVKLLKELRYENVDVRLGDGSLGWPEEAPFDAVIITAAAPRMPRTLIDQLVFGGIMVFPLDSGWGHQRLMKVIRTEDGTEEHELYEVRFVPMRGDIEKR